MGELGRREKGGGGGLKRLLRLQVQMCRSEEIWREHFIHVLIAPISPDLPSLRYLSLRLFIFGINAPTAGMRACLYTHACRLENGIFYKTQIFTHSTHTRTLEGGLWKRATGKTAWTRDAACVRASAPQKSERRRTFVAIGPSLQVEQDALVSVLLPFTQDHPVLQNNRIRRLGVGRWGAGVHSHRRSETPFLASLDEQQPHCRCQYKASTCKMMLFWTDQNTMNLKQKNNREKKTQLSSMWNNLGLC